RLLLHVVECVEHQQGLLKAVGGNRAERLVVQQVDQRRHVVAAEHGAQQFRSAPAADQRVLLAAEGQRGQVRRLDLGGLVHAGGDAVDQQVEQELFLAGGRGLEQFDDVGGLPRIQRQRRNAERFAFG